MYISSRAQPRNSHRSHPSPWVHTSYPVVTKYHPPPPIPSKNMQSYTSTVAHHHRRPTLLLLLLGLLATVSARPLTAVKPASSTAGNDNSARARQNRTIALVCGLIGGTLFLGVVTYAVYLFCFKKRRAGGDLKAEDGDKSGEMQEARESRRRSIFAGQSIAVRVPTLIVNEERKEGEGRPFLEKGLVSRAGTPELELERVQSPTVYCDELEESKGHGVAAVKNTPMAERGA